MRLNKFIAANTVLSRRSADMAIEQGKITVNGIKAKLGTNISESDHVAIEGIEIKPKDDHKIIVLVNKPIGYVCSTDGQGSPTVYDLLPAKFKNLNIAGRLDKDSSGLVLLTNDGNLLYELTHPSQEKVKEYEVMLDKPLSTQDKNNIAKGVNLKDGLSKLELTKLNEARTKWKIKMHEGRNRQIRRTFAALNYTVKKLHRTKLANYDVSEAGGSKSLMVKSPNNNLNNLS